MRILAIETATDRCGVAVLNDAEPEVDLLLTRPRSHAEFLVPMIDQALSMARKKASDLDLVAVSMGPGSYTGLRIGVSAAKGLAFATGTPLVGVPSLQALALEITAHADPGDHVLTAFSARREEVYAALFAVGGGGLMAESRALSAESGGWWMDNGALKVVAGPAAVPLTDLVEWLPTLSGTVWLAGDGAASAAKALDAVHQEPRTMIHRPSPTLPTATAVGKLGREILGADGPADLAAFEPYYLKEFVAKKPKRTIFDRLPF